MWKRYVPFRDDGDVIIPINYEMLVDNPPFSKPWSRLTIRPITHLRVDREWSESSIPFWDSGYSYSNASPISQAPYYPINDDRFVTCSDGFGSGLTERVFSSIEQENPARMVESAIPCLKDLRSTIHMIRNPLEGIFAVAGVMSRKSWGHKPLNVVLKEFGKKTSGTYLEYLYAWRPLLNDIVSTYEALHNVRNSYREYLALNKLKSVTRRWSSFTSETTQNPVESTWLASTEHKARCFVWGTLTFSGPTLSYFDFIVERMGLSTDAWPQAAWDIIPYSFVLDHFVPVGKVLASITHTPVDFNVSAIMYDYTRKTKGDAYVRYNGFRVPGSNAGTGGHLFSQTATHYSRSTSPILGGDVPWFNNGFVASSLALIAQRMRLPVPK